MKTRILIVWLAGGVLTVGEPAQAAGNRGTTSVHTTAFDARHHAHPYHVPAALSHPGASGVIPRAIRNGDFLQMLNPFASAKYGTAEENVSLDPDVPGKANGINLFTVSF